MKILPADLGETWHLALTRRRTGGKATGRPLNALERRWVRDQNLSEPVAEASVKAADGAVAGAVALVPLAAVVAKAFLDPLLPGFADSVAAAGIGLAAGAAGILTLGPMAIRGLHETPVSDKELVQMLRAVAGPSPSYVVDPISDFVSKLLGVATAPPPPREIGPEEAFLHLAREIVALDGLAPDAETALRETLRTIGDAVSALPDIAVPEVDPAELVAEARYILRRAEAERDRVVEASLVRQARALVDQSKAVERTLTLARRTRVLRRELLTQIDSLRASLPSLTRAARVAADSTATYGAFQMAADGVRNVAREAVSVADAREELAVSLDPTWTRASSEAAQIQRLGR